MPHSFTPRLILKRPELVAIESRETLDAPVGAPGIGDQPVLDALLHSPADDLDGMSANERSGGVLTMRSSKQREDSNIIDAAGVVVEIFVDVEGCFHGSSKVNLLLNRLLVSRNAIGAVG